jgi:hypothetical protein
MAGFQIKKQVHYSTFFKDFFRLENRHLVRKSISMAPKNVARMALWSVTTVLVPMRDSLAVIAQKP